MGPPPLRIVVASDKFKGSLPAAEVAAALSRGIHRVLPSASVVAVPVADGGDGTLAAAAAAGFSVVPTTVTGPTGEPVRSAYARRGGTAIVELADASGLERLVNGFAPLTAGTLGTGELVAAAVDAGCTEVVLGVGGSCSTDGGAGLAVALGAGCWTRRVRRSRRAARRSRGPSRWTSRRCARGSPGCPSWWPPTSTTR